MIAAARALLGFALLGFVMGTAAVSSSPAAERTKINFMYLPVADYVPLFVAKEKGYFYAFGVDVTLTPKDATSETIPLLVAGKVEAAGVSWAASFFNAVSLGATVDIVAHLSRMPPSGPPPSDLVIADKLWREGTHDAAGLKGKRIGILGAGAFTTYLTSVILESAHLTVKDAELVHLPPSAFAQAFANGSIDAGLVFEPFITIFERQGLAHPIVTDVWHNIEVGAIAFNADFDKMHEDATVGFVAALLKAGRELNDGGWRDPATQEIVKKYMKIDATVLGVIGVTLVDPNGKIDMDSVLKQEAFYRQHGDLTYSGRIDTKSFYRPDIAAKAVTLLSRQSR
jgi:NitT/TauT family transport system substrate-binding protein